MEWPSISCLCCRTKTTGIDNGTVDNYNASGSGTFNDYQYTGRIDYSVSQKLQLFGRYTHANFKLSGSPVFGTEIGGPGLGYLGWRASRDQELQRCQWFQRHFEQQPVDRLPVRILPLQSAFHKVRPERRRSHDLGTSRLEYLRSYDGGLPALGLRPDHRRQYRWFNGIGEGLNISRCNCPLIEKEQGYPVRKQLDKIQRQPSVQVRRRFAARDQFARASDANRTGILNFNHQGTSDKRHLVVWTSPRSSSERRQPSTATSDRRPNRAQWKSQNRTSSTRRTPGAPRRSYDQLWPALGVLHPGKSEWQR